MRTIERSFCVACNSTKFVLKLLLKQVPVYMGTTIQERHRDLYADQKWVICETCGCLQLKELLPLNVLYSQNHSSVTGEVWASHHKEFASFILRNSNFPNPVILEIGAAHGTLAKLILEMSNPSKYIIVEPDPVGTPPKNVQILRGFYEAHLTSMKEANLVVHSHVLEHLYKPYQALELMSKEMKDGSQMFISFPNIKSLIIQWGTNSLNFEHTYYLHPIQFEWFVRNHGFSIGKIMKYREHSFFYALTKRENNSAETLHENIPSIHSDSEKFIDMWDGITRLVSNLNHQLPNLDKDTFLFGAHVFSQSLVSAGLREDLIKCVLDNDAAKQGKRLYGTRLFVNSPEILRNLSSPRVICLATHYQHEIEAQLIQLNPSVEIIRAG